MSDKNAGYVNIQGDAIFDPSGSKLSQFNASNASINGTLTTNTLSVPQLTTTNNLTVGRDFDINGFNLYDGKFNAGDVIDCKFICFLDTSAVNNYFANYAGAGTSLATFQIPGAISNVNVYELVYWGVDQASTSTIRMSATLLVPTNIAKSTIFACKHGTTSTTYQQATLWEALKTYKLTGNPFLSNGTTDFSPMAGAIAGYVSVSADNPGYGIAGGVYDLMNTPSEVSSQYHAILATAKLIKLRPGLFNGFVLPVGNIPVINNGYSLGGIKCLEVGQLIQSDATNGITCVNNIVGAPANIAAIYNQLLLYPTLKISAALLFFTTLIFNDSEPFLQKNCILPNIYTDVLPYLNSFYVNSNILQANNVANNTSLLGNIWAATLASVIKNNPTNPTYWPSANPANQFYYPITLFDLSGFNVYKNKLLEQGAYYTNKFVNYSDLSGVPINVLYSQEDELCCYDPSNGTSPYGKASCDQVVNYLKGFMTDSSFTNVYGVTERSPINNLGLVDGSSYRVGTEILYNYVNNPNLLGFTNFYTAMSNKFLASETGRYSTTTPVNTLTGSLSPVLQPALNHAYFLATCNFGVLITYLKARS
jgi:hypothetical protein